MKDYRFKQGYKIGTEKRVVPGVGLMLIDNNISDNDAKALIAAGVTDIVEPVKSPVVSTPKTVSTNGKAASKAAIGTGAAETGKSGDQK